MKQQELIEGVHFYFNNEGYKVLTEKYHLEKGSCCVLGCLHCPYEYININEPERSMLLKKRSIKENS